MEKYVKLKSVVHILDLVMTDTTIKHTGKAIRKRLRELPRANLVEVCRCDECEYYIPINELEGTCDRHGIDRWYEDFCSDWQKKEGVEE
jgi:hypothetical protein